MHVEPVIRRTCVICDNSVIKDLYVLKDFPVFMGCVSFGADEDKRMDMEWGICSGCGTVQLKKLAPLSEVYQENHNLPVGTTWTEHHAAFADFVAAYGRGNKLEVGGASGILATLIRERDKEGRYVILEPNPHVETAGEGIEFHRGFLEDGFSPPFDIDTVIHCHVMEHWYDPLECIRTMHKLLPEGGRIIFAVPRMEALLRDMNTNCLNFEHTYYLDEKRVDHMYSRCGFRPLARQYHKKYVIFFAFEKAREAPAAGFIPDGEGLRLFEDFVRYHEELVLELNRRVSDYDGPVYIFGAHIFSIYLFAFGLRQDLFLKVLDNSPLKVGRRLYGTDLITESPKCLKDHKRALVVLRAGMYTEEIRNDILKNINPEVEFC